MYKRQSADILIVGGGPAGLMAAQAAAGEGLKVMLVESRGYLGGNLTVSYTHLDVYKRQALLDTDWYAGRLKALNERMRPAINKLKNAIKLKRNGKKHDSE